MKLKILLFPILTLFLLSACGAVTPGGDPLDGTSWLLTSYRKTRVVEGSTITIEFKDGRAGGSAGCNRYGSAYEVNGKQIRFQEMESTLMACVDSDVMEQESTYLKYLADAQIFELAESQLRLILSDGETLTFVPAP